MAISQVSRTQRAESVWNSVRMGIEDGSDIAPIASAACWMIFGIYECLGFFWVAWRTS
jgi:hypothetical protein